MSTSPNQEASTLPPDSLQALIERDASGDFLRNLLADFDDKLREIETAKRTATDEANDFLVQLQQTIESSTGALRQVWSMYHGDM